MPFPEAPSELTLAVVRDSERVTAEVGDGVSVELSAAVVADADAVILVATRELVTLLLVCELLALALDIDTGAVTAFSSASARVEISTQGGKLTVTGTNSVALGGSVYGDGTINVSPFPEASTLYAVAGFATSLAVDAALVLLTA